MIEKYYLHFLDRRYGARPHRYEIRFFYKKEKTAIAKITVEKIGENNTRTRITYCFIDDGDSLMCESESLEELLGAFPGCAVDIPLAFHPPESFGTIFFDEENNVMEKYLPLEKEEQDKVIEYWKRKASKDIIK